MNAATPFASMPRRSPWLILTVGEAVDEAGSAEKDIRIEAMAAKLAVSIAPDYAVALTFPKGFKIEPRPEPLPG